MTIMVTKTQVRDARKVFWDVSHNLRTLFIEHINTYCSDTRVLN